MDSVTFLRQFITSYLQGVNADALIGALADGDSYLQNLAQQVNDQLYISTANSFYLAKKLADLGISIDPDIGLSDESARQLGITINAQKQIVEVIHEILSVFYGPQAVRGNAISTLPAPYFLNEGDDLIFSLEDGVSHSVIFHAADFDNIQQATAQEVADSITRYIISIGLNGFAQVYHDYDTNLDYVQIFGGALGPYSLIKVLGGKAQVQLQFPDVRATDLTPLSNNTTWQISRIGGDVYRFIWHGGNPPKLDQVRVGDNVLIYGPQFATADQNLVGTFPIVNVRTQGTAQSYTAGYFDIINPNITALTYTPPGQAPASGTPPNSYVINQVNYDDLIFTLPHKNTPYSQAKYALAFEPREQLLKIYLPVLTQVVERDLYGGAHLHALYPATELNGSFTGVTVLNDYTIRYPQEGLDVSALGGTLTYGTTPTTVPINYVSRYNGFTTVITSNPHGIIGDNQWSSSLIYDAGAVVWFNGQNYLSTPTVLPITSIVGNGTTATVTLPNTCEYSVGQYVAIQGNSETGFNVNAQVASVSGNTFTFASTDSNTGTGGTVNQRPSSIFPSQDPNWISQGYADNTYSGVVGVNVEFVSADDPVNLWNGPHVWDDTEPYALTTYSSTLQQAIGQGDSLRTLVVNGSIPDQAGYLIFDCGLDTQESGVPYIGAQLQSSQSSISINTISQVGNTVTVLLNSNAYLNVGENFQISGTVNYNGIHTVSAIINGTILQFVSGVSATITEHVGSFTPIVSGTVSTILINPAYIFKQSHSIGGDVTVISQTTAYQPLPDGSDYNFYLTADAPALTLCENLITSILASGINYELILLYSSDIGWGNEGDSTLAGAVPQSDAVEIFS